jgi:pyridoxal phosphate enzyme (YggS family)
LVEPVWREAISPEDFAANLADVNARIAAACLQAGRSPASVRLLPVSKTWPAERVRLAWQAGLREFGENRIQEASAKARELADLDGLRWAIIGHLQSNKARQLVRFASEFHALDSLALALELDKRLQQAGRGLDVLVQINTSGEASKFGLAPQDAAAFLHALRPYSALRVRGLMTLALHSRDVPAVRQCFAGLRVLRDHLQQIAPAGMQLDELSMGMSGDFELAIAEGATTVRIGQALFGPRVMPDALFWPGLAQ